MRIELTTNGAFDVSEQIASNEAVQEPTQKASTHGQSTTVCVLKSFALALILAAILAGMIIAIVLNMETAPDEQKGNLLTTPSPPGLGRCHVLFRLGENLTITCKMSTNNLYGSVPGVLYFLDNEVWNKTGINCNLHLNGTATCTSPSVNLCQLNGYIIVNETYVANLTITEDNVLMGSLVQNYSQDGGISFTLTCNATKQCQKTLLQFVANGYEFKEETTCTWNGNVTEGFSTLCRQTIASEKVYIHTYNKSLYCSNGNNQKELKFPDCNDTISNCTTHGSNCYNNTLNALESCNTTTCSMFSQCLNENTWYVKKQEINGTSCQCALTWCRDKTSKEIRRDPPEPNYDTC